MTPLNVQDVIELIRGEIDRVGGQSEWARQTGIQRPVINRVLNGRRLPPSQLCRILGLEWIIVRQIAQGASQAEAAPVSQREFHLILREEIKRVGSIIAWSRLMGVNRSHLSSVLHKRRPPDRNLLAALNLAQVLVRLQGSDAATRSHKAARARRRHAQW
jgi:DNA-binding transcriptional regulator YdaS (Cro superfamily)